MTIIPSASWFRSNPALKSASRQYEESVAFMILNGLRPNDLTTKNRTVGEAVVECLNKSITVEQLEAELQRSVDQSVLKSGTSEGAILGWEHRKKHGYIISDPPPLPAFVPVDEPSKAWMSNTDEPAPSIHNLTREQMKEGRRVAGMPNYEVWQERTFRAWNSNLTNDEQSSIAQYVGEDYDGVNGLLRGINDDSNGQLATHLTSIIEGMDSAVKKNVTAQDIVVMRGMGAYGVEIADKLETGRSFSDNGFISTSIDPVTAWAFSDSGRGVIFSIKVPKGSHVMPGSMAESEVILPRGSRFKVTSYNPETRTCELELLPERAEKSEVGDKEGHPFRGNQYTQKKLIPRVEGESADRVDPESTDEFAERRRAAETSARRLERVRDLKETGGEWTDPEDDEIESDEELPDDDENHGEEPEEEETVEQDSDEDTEREDRYAEDNDENDYNNPDDSALANAVIDLPDEPVKVSSDAESRELIRKYFGQDSTVKQLAQVFTGGLDLLREKLPEDTELNISFSASVGTDDNDRIELQVDCTISYDELGKRHPTEIASFERSFKREYGELSVEHDLFKVAPWFRGTGYGSEMFYQSEDAYKKMGVSEIRVHANIDIGGYAWARMGFAFNDPYNDAKQVRRLISNRFSEEIESRLDDDDRDDRYPSGWPQEVRDAYSKVLDDLEGLEHPYEFAAYRVNYKGNDLALGKDAMASSGCDWHGTKSLNEYDEDHPNIRAGEEYKRIKTGKKSKGKDRKSTESAIGSGRVTHVPVPDKEPTAAVPADDTPPGGLLGTTNGIIGRPESTRAPGYDDEAVEGNDGRLYQYDPDADQWTIIDFESTMEGSDGKLIGRPISGDNPQSIRYDINGNLRRFNYHTNKWVDVDDPDAIASNLERDRVHKSAAKPRNGIEAHYDVDSPDDVEWAKRLKELGLIGKRQEKLPASKRFVWSAGEFELLEEKAKHDVSDEARDESGKWTSGDGVASAKDIFSASIDDMENGVRLEGMPESGWLSKFYDRFAVKGLSSEEKSALDEYTGSAYEDVNGSLRGMPNKPDRAKLQDSIDLLDSALSRMTLDRDVTVVRGLLVNQFVANLIRPGAVFVDRGYVSTTVSTSTATQFSRERDSKEHGDSNYMTLAIHVPKGTHFLPGSLSESEVILPRSSKFKVTRFDEKNGRAELEYLGQEPISKSETVSDFDAEYPVPLNATEVLSMQSGLFRFRRKKKKKREDKSGTWEEDQHPRREDGKFTHQGSEAQKGADDFANLKASQNLEINDAERKTIADYGDTSYLAVNARLRGTNSRWQSEELFIGHTEKQADILDSAFSKVKQFGRPVTVYRSSSVDPEQLSVGDVFEDKGFISTSFKKEIAGGFDTPTMIEIRLSGKEKLLYGRDDEFEAILDRGTRFKVIGKGMADKKPLLIVETMREGWLMKKWRRRNG